MRGGWDFGIAEGELVTAPEEEAGGDEGDEDKVEVSHGEKGEGEKTGAYGVIKKMATLLKIVGVTALFIVAFNRAGYLVASSLYLFILLLWVSRYRIFVSAALAVAIGVGSWYFFAKILVVPLPQGFLPF